MRGKILTNICIKSWLPEERGLHPKMTVEEELTYLATLKGLSSRDIQQRIDYWLERFAITENRKETYSIFI